ncbi:MAG: hypothetical protein CMJ62_05065 [Planctomycetaceae bacterium]|nr:hypothetical protein [Planctomycetaceae bacterium]
MWFQFLACCGKYERCRRILLWPSLPEFGSFLRFPQLWYLCAVALLFIGLSSRAVCAGEADFKWEVGPRTEAIEWDAYQETRYVSQAGGSDSQGDGSRTHPWQSLQFALQQIEFATGRHRVALLIAEGTYSDSTVELREHVDLYGGFTTADWSRNINEHTTVLSGEGQRRVVLGADHARIDGFIVTGGSSTEIGAGILCHHSAPIISNNRIVSNGTVRPDGTRDDRTVHQIGNGGGGICCIAASPTIRHNLIARNTTEFGNGAGILCLRHAAPTVEKNFFHKNVTGIKDPGTRSSNGGAVACSHHASPLVGTNVFLENHAGGRGDGGAIYGEYFCSPRVVDNLFIRNNADDDGAALYVMTGSRPKLIKNLFTGNGHVAGGATIRLSKNGAARLERNVIVGNPAGGVVCGSSMLESMNNLICRNASAGMGGVQAVIIAYNDTICDQDGVGVDVESGSIRIVNCILTGNRKAPFRLPERDVSLSHCVIEGNGFFAGQPFGASDGDQVTRNDRVESSLDVDPLFKDDSFSGKVRFWKYDVQSSCTRFQLLSKGAPARQWVGRPLQLNDTWSVVSRIDEGIIDVLGDLRYDVPAGQTLDLSSPRTYHLAADSPCVDSGKTLGAPSGDLDGDSRMKEVDIGADEW